MSEPSAPLAPAQPSKERFEELLARRGVCLFDGAMGTMLYSKGVFIHRAFEELNLTDPMRVREVHETYVAAGAHVIETNTFAANRFRLAPHGLADEVERINAEGVALARQATAGRAWVAGSMGPLGVRIEPFGAVAREEAREVFAQQAKVLAEAGVDLFVLETFVHLPELEEAIRAVRAASDAPIVAQVQVRSGARTREGVAAAEAAKRMAAAGAHVIGVNCSDALATLDALEQMRHATDRVLLGQPNAGTPRSVAGRSIYLASPDYVVAWGRRALRFGVTLLGGCCGTTPDHIRALASAVTDATPAVSAESVAPHPEHPPAAEPVPRRERSALARALDAGELVTGLEVLPPRGWTAEQVLATARELATVPGARVLSLPEGPPDGARLPPTALAAPVAESGLEALVHYSCRGRRLVRMQTELLGVYAVGVRNLMLVTGDPLEPGTDPDNPPDLEVDSIGAVNLAARLNRGEDVGGSPIGKPTGFHVAVRLDPTAHDLEREVHRFRWKVDAGAELAVTVPVFDPGALSMLLERIEPERIPVIATVWPLSSSREAEFFEHEMAQVPVPSELVERMRAAEEQGRAAAEGVLIAKELAASVRPLVEGVIVVAPPGQTERALTVLRSIR